MPLLDSVQQNAAKSAPHEPECVQSFIDEAYTYSGLKWLRDKAFEIKDLMIGDYELDTDGNGKILVDPIKDPNLAKAMTARTPEQQESRATAIGLETLAINYFADSYNGDDAVQTANERLDLQNQLQTALKDPQKSLQTANFLQTFEKIGNDEGTEIPVDDGSDFYLPGVTFTMSKDNTLSGICIGYGPSHSKFGEDPGDEVCATKLASQ
jgi:hypothetical protein